MVDALEAGEQHLALIHCRIEAQVPIDVGVDDQVGRLRDHDSVVDDGDAERSDQRGFLYERMRRVGLAVVVRVLKTRTFLLGLVCMAIAFYSLLFALSWNDVSLVGPAAASLTFVGNAFAAGIFLHENVDRRRWMAALFVAAGVFLIA